MRTECHYCDWSSPLPANSCPECGASWVQALLGGIAGAVSPSHYYADKKSQQHQQNAEEDFAKHQIEWRKQDLINSGFNPLLAVGEGATMGGVSSAAHSSSVGSGAAEGMARERQQNLSSAVGIAQRHNLDADTALKTATARKMSAEADMAYATQDAEIGAKRGAAGQSAAESRVLEDTRGEISERIRNIRADTSFKEVQSALEAVRVSLGRLSVAQQLKILPDLVAQARQAGSAGRGMGEDGSTANAVFRWFVDKLNALRGPAQTGQSAAGAAAALNVFAK